MTSLGLAVDDVEHVGATVDGVVTARVVRTERHPDAAKVHRVYVDAGDGVERHVWCGAFNMQAGDVVPLADARHDDARRSHDRAARHPRHRLRRDALLGARARPRRRPRRHPDPAAGHAARRAVRRGARARARRAVRPRRHPQPARLLGLRRRRPRPRCPARTSNCACRPRQLAVSGDGVPRTAPSRSSTAIAAGASRRPSCPASSSARRPRGCSAG